MFTPPTITHVSWPLAIGRLVIWKSGPPFLGKIRVTRWVSGKKGTPGGCRQLGDASRCLGDAARQGRVGQQRLQVRSAVGDLLAATRRTISGFRLHLNWRLSLDPRAEEHTSPEPAGRGPRSAAAIERRLKQVRVLNLDRRRQCHRALEQRHRRFRLAAAMRPGPEAAASGTSTGGGSAPLSRARAREHPHPPPHRARSWAGTTAGSRIGAVSRGVIAGLADGSDDTMSGIADRVGVDDRLLRRRIAQRVGRGRVAAFSVRRDHSRGAMAFDPFVPGGFWSEFRPDRARIARR